MWIGTFHSLCARILRQKAQYIGYSNSYSIFDESDQVSCVKSVLKELEIDDRTIQPKHALNHISACKNLCVTPDEAIKQAQGFYQQEIAKIYERYQRNLVRQNAMDFDDLITNTVLLFRRCPDVLAGYQKMFHYILVDEYQDTNASQFLLIKYLGQTHGRIFVVGDDDQSIYGWRGAQIENILSFESQFPAGAVFKLEQNYRSTSNILEFANSIISGNINRASKTLWTDRKGGDDVTVTRYEDDRQEAEYVCASILSRSKTGLKLSDIAILFRTNAQSRVFEDALRKRNLPYVMVGGMSFYERKEIKDCLAYMRLIVNPKDDVSLDRIINVPARGIGDKSRDTLAARARASGRSMLESIMASDFGEQSGKSMKGLEGLKELYLHLNELAAAGTKPNIVLDELLTLSGYMDSLETDENEESQSRIDNINELLNAMSGWSAENSGRGIDGFLEDVTLASAVDRWDDGKEAVSLMTLHCAKGLEFPVVFLVGIEDGLIPSRQNFDDPSKIEEECRLMYVGSTRAINVLECSHVDVRWRFGSVMPMSPSRFLDRVPSGAYQSIDRTRKTPDPVAFNPVRKVPVSGVPLRTVAPIEPKHEDFSQEEVQFRMGQHVSHKTYGPGKILSVSGFGPDTKLTILFNGGVRKKIMARFANFES
jgi:DNA helicase-2/ATP-dependent DNA helicase PcrA